MTPSGTYQLAVEVGQAPSAGGGAEDGAAGVADSTSGDLRPRASGGRRGRAGADSRRDGEKYTMAERRRLGRPSPFPTRRGAGRGGPRGRRRRSPASTRRRDPLARPGTEGDGLQGRRILSGLGVFADCMFVFPCLFYIHFYLSLTCRICRMSYSLEIESFEEVLVGAMLFD